MDGKESSDYEPSENSSDSDDEVTFEPEVDPESEGNDDDSQATTSNVNRNSTPTRPVDNVVIATKGLQDRNINVIAGTTVVITN